MNSFLLQMQFLLTIITFREKFMSKESVSKEEKKAKKESKKDKKAIEKEAKKRIKGLWGEFKAFISRGNVLDMAVGVVIGGAFSAIVTSVVNVLLSVCTWGVPGGITGLITVLPAANATQAGITGVGQTFLASDLVTATEAYAHSVYNVTVDPGDVLFLDYQAQLLKSYTLYGNTYVYSGAAIINWGAIINAVISFLIIAIVLFTIIKVVARIRSQAVHAAEKIKEQLPENEDEGEKHSENKKAE